MDTGAARGMLLLPAMDGPQLWARARGGDRAARDELCALAREIAARELARRGARGESLADLVQESVRSTLAYLGSEGTPPRELAAFLKFRAWGILSDHRKHMRARRLELQDPDDALGALPAAAEHGLDDELERGLADCRAHLDEGLRRLLELRYDEQRETGAIAVALGIHRNTVAVRVFRALELLRECLRRKGLTPGGAG